ncbi:hypothetical protein NKR23_g3794 [Pleurostoma richardsiae]|uniref:Uncharacterized protein n=1 Tax=Pleurostoma richardsiae TaxID=41990 RepID=A0AA38S3Z2_9PEZI|nr:hypothetical protein NKR23_g3794 [Pleurostoma richardsiae]
MALDGTLIGVAALMVLLFLCVSSPVMLGWAFEKVGELRDDRRIARTQCQYRPPIYHHPDSRRAPRSPVIHSSVSHDRVVHGSVVVSGPEGLPRYHMSVRAPTPYPPVRVPEVSLPVFCKLKEQSPRL